MKYFFYTFLVLISITCLAKDKHKLLEHLNSKEYGGLKKIIEDRYLRILTTKNSFDFYIYQGKAKGIQYEMAREFVAFFE